MRRASSCLERSHIARPAARPSRVKARSDLAILPLSIRPSRHDEHRTLLSAKDANEPRKVKRKVSFAILCCHTSSPFSIQLEIPPEIGVKFWTLAVQDDLATLRAVTTTCRSLKAYFAADEERERKRVRKERKAHIIAHLERNFAYPFSYSDARDWRHVGAS